MYWVGGEEGKEEGGGGEKWLEEERGEGVRGEDSGLHTTQINM